MEEIEIESTLVEAIKTGEKTLEAQPGIPRLLKIQEGDVMSVQEDFWFEGKVLESLSHALEIRITQILYFESFAELFEAVDFQLAVPAAKTADEAVAKYREFYTKQEEAELGVVAFSFELVT